MSAAVRFVPTRAIQSVVRGREAEVLDKLGIDWKAGRPHVACPYPGHADNDPSWRWHEKKHRAFCTCIEGSHSIFDVVMNVRGADFETAKLFVAEAIGREDLIQERGGERRHATDARSLLTPPADQRDDELPRSYLAHRLGTEPGDVLMPSTPAVGWKALEYWDPPAKKKGSKPELVGRYPCAVFGTIDADNRKHAHRIYVAPGGAGKAELGTRKDGARRDPKKAAKVAEGDNTAGRSVLWGDPKAAPRIILAEGIETAAAVALAFQAAIEAGALAVAAAITAGGVEAFMPYPATKRVTVAADRDEDPAKEGTAGYRRGERAAREFGLRQRERLEVPIALPGNPGTKTDWLDVLRRDGAEAVRAGIEAAELFAPTKEELVETARREARESELNEADRTYPLPLMESMTLSYQCTRSGRVMVHLHVGTSADPAAGEKIDIWVPVATPFGVIARLRHADHADAYGLRVAVQAMDGRLRAVDFEREALARMGASEIKGLLFAAGLRVENDGDTIAVKALKAAGPGREIVVVSRPGWHRLEGVSDPMFVTPGGEVLGAPESCALELAAGARLALPARAGTLDGWRNAVEAALGAQGCPHWTLGVAAGFAGPLVALTDLDTCGISLSGLSSAGKTTAQRLAASAWASPKIGAGLLQSMRSTENALESLAQASNGTVLALDEAAHADGRAIARMIYSIAGEVGKTRMRADATLKGRYGWKTFAVLSGEISLEQKVRRDGGQWQPGMAVRLPDVDTTGLNRLIQRSVLDAIAAIERHHGHAGPVFVEALIAEGYHRAPDLLREQVLRTASKLTGEGADGARNRAAQPFALLVVAGELAAAFGLLPEFTDISGAVAWAWEKFLASSDAAVLDPDEQAISCLQSWIAERWDVTIKDVNAGWETPDGKRLNNRESVAWYDGDAVYLPTQRLSEAAGGGQKEQQIADMLERRGYLFRRSSAKRRAVRYVPKVGHIDCYALTRNIFGRTGQAEPEFAVYEGGRR